MVFSTLNNSFVGSFFGSIKNATNTLMGGGNTDDNHLPNDPNHELIGDGDGEQTTIAFRPMTESLSPTTIAPARFAFPTCDVCLHEQNAIVPTNYYCGDCELALCREHVRKHYLDGKNHKIFDPRSNYIVNMNDIDDSDDDDDIEIVTVESLPVSTANDDDFEHHQIFQVSDSVLDVNNLTEEEEEIINMNNQDFIYWTRLLKTYPHFSTNIIHTPLIIRKLYMNGALGGSLLIDNRTQHPINVILSQVGPLYQLLIPPNRMGIFEGVGRVHFTVEVGKLHTSKHKQLTTWDKALPIIGTVCGSVAVGVGIASGVLTGVGLIGGGAALVVGGGLSTATIASAPAIASVASVVNKKNGNKSEDKEKETLNTTSNYNISENETIPADNLRETIDGADSFEIIEHQDIIEETPEPTETKEQAQTTSKIGEVSKWIKKLVPGKATFPHSSVRGVFCDGHSIIIVSINDEDVRNQNDEAGYFDLELKTF